MQKNEVLINGGALNAPVVSALAAEQFLTENYCFRRNLLNGKVEFATKQADGQASDYRPLTQEALNSIILRAKREDICEGSNPKTDIVEYIHSEEVCFRKPAEDEHVTPMNASELINYIQSIYPSFPDNISTRVRMGKAMKLLGYDSTNRAHACYFKAVPVKQSAKVYKAA